MSRISMSVLLAAVLGAASPALANNPNPGVSPPGSNAYGKSLADWTAAWWQWMLKIDTADHPALGGSCSEGQSGKGFHISADFLAGVGVPCTIPTGKAVLVPIVNVECSNVEPPPFFGGDAEELTACATCWGDHIVVSSLTIVVDGVPLQALETYRAVSPMFGFEYPADNIFGIAGGPSTGLSVGDGYWIMLQPLSAGEHTVSFSGGFEFPDGDEGCNGSGGGFSFGFGGDYVLTVGN